MKKCIICGKKGFKEIWYGKLRNSSKVLQLKKKKSINAYNVIWLF